MSVQGPMLQDIHVPPAAWWPPAPGWWIVAGLVLLAVGVAAWLRWRHSRGRLLRATLREVDALAAMYAHDGDVAQLADGASRLLRRVACVVEPGAAAHPGDAWRKFVHRYARDAQGLATLDRLDGAVFRPCPDIDPAATLAALRTFSRHALRAPHPNPLPSGERETSAQLSARDGLAGNVRSRSAPDVSAS